MGFDFNRDAAKLLDKKQAQKLLLMKGLIFYIIAAALLVAGIVLLFFVLWLGIVLIVLALVAGRFGAKNIFLKEQKREDLLTSILVAEKIKSEKLRGKIFTKEDIKEKTVRELTEGVEKAFGFDHFKWQKEQGLKIHQNFRADGLHRILYKCTDCGAEGKMEGRGTTITCKHCGQSWELTELGQLKAKAGDTKISHIPDWYRWEREQVRQEILDGTYKLDCDVDIAIQVDYKAIYKVGSGHLLHDNNGFTLTGCDGKLNYVQKPQAHYSLYADYYWYEIADVICVGDA